MPEFPNIPDGFLRSVLNSITEHIVVIDCHGSIAFVNNSWITFGQDNACTRDGDWLHQNYLEICDRAVWRGDKTAGEAVEGVRAVIKGLLPYFYYEYPCHSPQTKRWFTMRVTPFDLASHQYYVITHQDITDRKLAEQQVRRLSRVDALTGLANRRTFDQTLHDEWQRARREGQPLSLAMLDIDHFKLINDTYGHPVGDTCLKKVGQTLTGFTNRPGDSCARYGGEEFALIWSNTSEDQARELANRLLHSVADLRIPNEASPTSPWLTISIGVSTVIPAIDMDEDRFITQADQALYQAKSNGRNRVA
ncbi:sensor domain-containing diguanylate cyclase [uncultured Marinobacter sp.]|uniref:sensor domain-containing diguanylate cyclase n=1 Tax=uncultured Marinobacter sp. TaxID=187379 RepID=UPI00262530A9|nr:sensor domain-containing diguanylate cyclase [uncultured Marinobacter sp.]